MSRIGASARRYYSDGITRVTDPFWKMKCNKCGHVFLSCICIAECPTCGSMDQKAFLDGKSLEEIKTERGEPTIPEYLLSKNQSLSEQIRDNQSLSEQIRDNQNLSELERTVKE